ncbi:MAG: DUF3177 family protein [Prochlorotrichaceae cyanobacterium]
MSIELLSQWVWTDYRLAVVFLVIAPLLLLLWAFVSQVEAIQRILTIYWRVSSLLAITVFLMIAAIPVSFLSGWLARVLIPLTLWFWVDLNEDIVDMAVWRPIKVIFNAWRWLATVYCGLGGLFSLFFVRCALLSKAEILTEGSLCRVWLNPPWGFREYFLANYAPGFIGFLGIVGLIFYAVCFGYYVIFRLGSEGRSATGN